jgi:hypothetical protein
MTKLLVISICIMLSKICYSQSTLFTHSYQDLQLSSEKKNKKNIKEEFFLKKVSKTFINSNSFKKISDTSLLKKLFKREIDEITFEKSGHVSIYRARSFFKTSKITQEAVFEFYFFDSVIVRKSFQFTFPNDLNTGEININKSHVKSLENLFQKNDFRFNPKINMAISDTLFLDILQEIQNKNIGLTILPLFANQYSDTINYVYLTYSSFGFSIFKYFFPFKEIVSKCDWNMLKQLTYNPNLCIKSETIELIKFLNSDSLESISYCKTFPQNTLSKV